MFFDLALPENGPHLVFNPDIRWGRLPLKDFAAKIHGSSWSLEWLGLVDVLSTRNSPFDHIEHRAFSPTGGTPGSGKMVCADAAS